ncbi:unknown [Bacteroides sp. CAG:1060]|nr:unknown [Bacteroides sp. CAG:1060]
MSLTSTSSRAMAAMNGITEAYLRVFMNSTSMSSGSSSFQFRSRRSNVSRPWTASLRSSASSSCLILLLALEVVTQFNQSRVGR